MEREPYPEPRQLTGIHINFEDQAIEFEDRHGTIGRLVFGQETVLYEGQPLLLAPTDDPRTDTESAKRLTRTDQQPCPPRAPRPAHDPSPPNPRREA